MQMGQAASAHNAQRVTFLLVKLLNEAADAALPTLLIAEAAEFAGSAEVERPRELIDSHFALRTWASKRSTACRGDRTEGLTFFISSFQDDITIFCAGHTLQDGLR